MALTKAVNKFLLLHNEFIHDQTSIIFRAFISKIRMFNEIIKLVLLEK